MKKFREIAEAELQKARIENLKQVRLDLQNKDEDLLTKIDNFCERWDNTFNYEAISKGIIENDLIAAQFAKDPKKQNTTEKLASKLIKVPLLPQRGSNVIRFDKNGNIIHKKDGDECKAADFYFNNAYITQKYTSYNSGGGAQDNQKSDVIKFLDFGSKQYKVGALLDGEYWDNGRRVELKEKYKYNNNVIILSVDDILNGDYIINAN